MNYIDQKVVSEKQGAILQTVKINMLVDAFFLGARK